jgi:hypothetical protein
LLSLLADEKGPTAPLTEKAEVRKKSHDAWKDWFGQHKIDVAKLDVDLPFGSIETRASKGAMQFIQALLKFDTKLLAKVTDVPFTFVGQLKFNTREEFDNFVNMFKDRGPAPPDLQFKPGKTVSGAEYVRTAPDTERDFLESARIAQITVVYMDINEGGRPESAPFFMRISGGRARCIGIGQPRMDGK